MTHIDTTCVQGGYQPGNGESRTPPIIQATTFKYTSSEQMSRLFDLSESGYFYTRLQNPTNDTVAAKICELEGGAIVDSGRFDWMAHADKFPGLTTPDDSYHGVTYATDFGPAAYIIKATAQLMRDFGSTPAPINSWIMGMHLESLAVRMERHCANALAVARFLEADPRISWVSYPGLEGDRNHALAAKYMPNGTCGVISFGVPGGRDTVSSLLDHFRMISIATHVADARSCTLYPAGTTHRQLTEEQLEEAGVGIDLVRLSCGIENADDIIADLRQAMDAVL